MDLSSHFQNSNSITAKTATKKTRQFKLPQHQVSCATRITACKRLCHFSIRQPSLFFFVSQQSIIHSIASALPLHGRIPRYISRDFDRTGTRPSSSQPLLSNAIERRNISEKRIPLPAISALRIPILIFFEALCGPGDTRQLATPGTVRLERQQQKQPTPLSRNGRRPARISTSRPTHP